MWSALDKVQSGNNIFVGVTQKHIHTYAFASRIVTQIEPLKQYALSAYYTLINILQNLLH